MKYKVWFFAGEVSGDLYGGKVIEALHQLVPDIEIVGMGGEAMQQAGMSILADSRHLGVTGFVEVIKILPDIWKIEQKIIQEARRNPPHLAVFIDYPGFNLRMARKLKSMGIRIVYYISPQIWAWHRSRIRWIPDVVDHMLVILPFEQTIYQKTTMRVSYVGHPLMEILKDLPERQRDPNLIALLPGSRETEIRQLLPAFHATAQRLQKKYPSFRFVIPTPSYEKEEFVKKLWNELDSQQDKIQNVMIQSGQVIEVLQTAIVGLAASGTITLQSAILGLPIVCVYRVNWLSYHIGRFWIRLPYISLPNWILQEKLIEEYLQNQVHPSYLVPAIERILPGTPLRERMILKFQAIRNLLDTKEKTSYQVAQIIVQELGLCNLF